MKPPHPEKQLHGFTVIELLVAIAVVVVLIVIQLPAFARATSKSQGIYCLNNQKQLILAAIVYSQENQDNWVPNYPGQIPGWASGGMDFNRVNTDNTNTAKLVNPAASVMGPFVRDAKIFHCPADESFVSGEGFRVRSVSMNQAVGTVGAGIFPLAPGSAVNGQWLLGVNIGSSRQTSWRTYGKTSSMNIPGAANLWVFIDEHPESINDGGFAVEMQTTGTDAKIIDFPASYHDGGCGISFADGHAVIHKWIGNTIKISIVNGGSGSGNGVSSFSANDSVADVTWLQLHTSAHE
jgi:prepilin-type N-terminal cleavage/methylation domain-containing protein/prepilin-type processing-associated H-X9-DG protein